MNRVVLITGASRGIGASTALQFAKNHDKVIINYCHSKERADALVQKIEEMGEQALAIACDITKENEIHEMVEKVIHTYGRIDVLVNNAAIDIGDSFMDHTVENFRKVIDTNLIGMFSVSREVSKYMLQEKKGVIINLSSNNGIDCYSPISIDYDASKAAIINLTHNLALQFAPYIRVNAVAPGWTKTESVMEMSPSFLEEETKKILLERMAEPEEIAKVIFFLASDEASYINSTVIRIDGGIK